MRRIALTASVAAIAIFGGSLVAASSALAGQQNYDVSDFDSVSAAGPNRIVIQVGSSPSVRADGPQETLDWMKVVVEDGQLKIQPMREHWGRDEWDEWEKIEPATYYVTVPRLSAAATAGSGEMTIDRVDGKRFSASIAGSGKLDIANLSVDDARFSVAGSGDLVPHGNVGRASFSIAGSGNVHANGLTSGTAKVSIAGSGDAELTVKDDVHISLVGSGDVEITGGARCAVSAMGSGKARCNGALVEDQGRGRWANWARWAGPPAPPAPPAPRWNWDPWDGRDSDGRDDRDDD